MSFSKKFRRKKQARPLVVFTFAAFVCCFSSSSDLIQGTRAESSSSGSRVSSSPHRGSSTLLNRDPSSKRYFDVVSNDGKPTSAGATEASSKNNVVGQPPTTPEQNLKETRATARRRQSTSKSPAKHGSGRTAMKAQVTTTTTPSPSRRKTSIIVSSTKTSSSSKGGREVTTILRLKREYRDAVRMGIAYDWVRQCTIVSDKPKRNNIKKTTTTTGIEQQKQQHSSFEKHQQVPTEVLNHRENSNASGTESNSSSEKSSSSKEDIIIADSRTIQSSQQSPKTDATMRHMLLGPLGTNLRVWHFSIRGPTGSKSPYSKGVYHGRVILPKDYPGSPPRVHILTPNGRFVPGLDICLSASSYHPESWTPQWTIQALLQSLRLHFLTEVNEIGGMHASPSQRRFLAMQSRGWRCELPSSMNPTRRRVIIDHPLMLSKGDLGDEPEEEQADEKVHLHDTDKPAQKLPKDYEALMKHDIGKDTEEAQSSLATAETVSHGGDQYQQEEEDEQIFLQVPSHSAKEAMVKSLRRELLVEKLVTVLGILISFLLFRMMLSLFGTGYQMK